MKGNVNVTSCKDIYMLPTLCQQVREGPFLSQYDCAPVHKASSTKTLSDEFGMEEQWLIQSPDLSPTEHIWDEL